MATSDKSIRFSERRWLAFSFGIFCVYIAQRFAITWWAGNEIRPLALAGEIVWIGTLWGLIWRRRRIKEGAKKEGDYRWYRFSLVELLALTTGLALLAGLLAEDASLRRHTLSQQKHLQTIASEALGLEGMLEFESNGNLTITVCDRSFDDQRLIELEKLIQNYVSPNKVATVLFGTRQFTTGTPAVWPGITDASVKIFLKWQDMHMLAINGTGLSKEGRTRLLSLENLNEWSQINLRRD